MCEEIQFATDWGTIDARIHESDDFFNRYFSLVVDTPIICCQFNKISEFFWYRFHFAQKISI